MIGTAPAPERLLYRVDPPRAHLEAIVRELVMDEAVDWAGNLILAAYAPLMEPVGAIIGRTHPAPCAPLGVLEFLGVRPAWRGHRVIFQLYARWCDYARGAGCQQAIARIRDVENLAAMRRARHPGPRPVGPRAMAGRVARRLGWRPYDADGDATWWVMDLKEGPSHV